MPLKKINLKLMEQPNKDFKILVKLLKFSVYLFLFYFVAII